MVIARLRRLVVALIALTLLGVLAPLTGAGAATGPVVPPEEYLVGGCRIAFDAAGRPSTAASADKPCIGVESVAANTKGDLDVRLTPEESRPAIRLMVAPSSQMMGRGIVAVASGGRDVIGVRLYDDKVGARVNLRSSAGRGRVAKTSVWVGWTKAGGQDAASVDPGVNALGRHHDRAATGAGTVDGGCVIRFSSAGASVHANRTHRCIGVRSVSISSTGKLVVTSTAEQRGAVVNVQADADETLTARGIAMGVSASSGQMIFTLYDSRLGRTLNLRRASDLRRVSGTYANAWLTWTKTRQRPGSANAKAVPATNAYGPYRDGSAAQGTIEQRGCTISFSPADARPRLSGSSVRLCTGVHRVSINGGGDLVVAGTGRTIVSTTTVGGGAMTDYGVRIGLSGGGSNSRYAMYSMKLNRSLDLRRSGDRAILRRSGTSLLAGWSHLLQA